MGAMKLSGGLLGWVIFFGLLCAEGCVQPPNGWFLAARLRVWCR